MSSTPQVGQAAWLFPPFHIPDRVDLLYRDEKIVALERRAVQVLRYLVINHGRVVPKDELLEAVWPDTYTTDGVLKRAISQARRALGDVADEATFIQTYHGRGYRFVAPVERMAERPEVPEQAVAPSVIQPLISSDAADLPPANATVFVRPVVRPATVSGVPDYNQLVGRETEMAQLAADYRRTLEGTGRPVLLIGEPGVGKTQLAREFANWARAQGAVCLYTQFFDYQASRLAPYEVFLDLLRSILGVNASNREDCDLRVLARNHFGVSLPEELFTDAKLTSQVRLAANTGALRLDEGSPYVTRPLALPNASGTSSGGSSRAVAPISQCLIRASHHRPLVLILDDVQWADDASREVIGYLMRTLQSEPLMAVCLARIESLNDRESMFADWLKRLAGYRSYTTLTLKPLDERATREAIEAVFGAAVTVPPNDLQTLHRVTGGNPYFLVEMLRLLVAERAVSFISSPEPNWQWNGIKDLSLPVTIVMAARAKLDRLSDEVREVAESASVIGDEFRIETMARMAGRDEDEIERLVLEGVRRGVLSERGVTGDNDARFYHNTLRRVLYDALPSRRRKRLHLAAAQAIEFVYSFELDRVADAVSAHYEAANHWAKTFEWSFRAWQAASSRLSWGEAMICIERANRASTELGPAGGNNLPRTEKLNLLFALGETDFAVGKLKESDAAYGEAALLARSIGDRARLATALLEQGQARTNLSLYKEAGSVTEQALEIYRATGDQEGAALALLQLGGVQVRLGNFDEAIRLAQQSLEGAPHNRQVAAIAFGLLGWARALQGNISEGVPLLERAVEYMSGVGDVQRRVLLLRRSHWAEMSRGRYETAVGLATRARDDAERLGDAAGEAKMEMGIGQARIAQGLFDEAVDILKRAREKLRAIGATHGEAEALWLLGRANCEMGNLAEARKLLEKAQTLILEIGDREDELRLITDLTRLSLAEGDGQMGLQFAEGAIAIAEELNNRDWLGAVLVEYGRALLMLQRNEEALDAVERGLEILEEAESGERWRAYLAKAKILLAKDPSSQEALALLARAVSLLDDIRRQVGQDGSRFEAITRARRAPAEELHALLLRHGQADKAREVGQAWAL